MPGRRAIQATRRARRSSDCRPDCWTQSRPISARRRSIVRSSARTMRASTQIGRLTADLLRRAGAIVESGPGQTIDVMAEPALRGALGLGELERLSFEPDVTGATFIDYDASLVDRLAA